MEKLELLTTLPDCREYATDESLMRWVEFTGPNAEFHNTMHCFLMSGLTECDVTCNFLSKLSDTEYSALKCLEIPMTLTVVCGGEAPSYAYYVEDKPVSRNELVGSVVIEEAMLNMEDTGRYVWDTLSGYFAAHGLSLGQVELRFGHVMEHFIVLCSRLTPDTMHLFDPDTGKRLWQGEPGAYERIKQRIMG